MSLDSRVSISWPVVTVDSALLGTTSQLQKSGTRVLSTQTSNLGGIAILKAVKLAQGQNEHSIRASDRKGEVAKIVTSYKNYWDHSAISIQASGT